MLTIIKLFSAYFISGRYYFKKLLFLFTSQYIIIFPLWLIWRPFFFIKPILNNLTNTDIFLFQILMVIIVTVNQFCILL